jgi:hypothetical protein
LGTWVDVYDYEEVFQTDGGPPTVSPSDVAAMQRAGAQTLYLQVAKDDPRSPGIITDPPRARAFLRNAHALGMRVVAWYLPTHKDPARDLARARALVRFTSGREHFDGVALDIEGLDVTDVAVRNQRLLSLVRTLDRDAGTMPIGAIVYPPVAFDVLNPALWPNFPWKEIAPHVDVWLPMAYWTFRDRSSPYRDAYRYTTENVQRLRSHVGGRSLPIHVIGGIGDTSTAADYTGMRRAATEQHTIGWSIYDFDTMAPSAWPSLRTTASC